MESLAVNVKIGNIDFEITDEEVKAHIIQEQYMDKAEKAAKQFVNKYKGYGTWETFVKNVIYDGIKIIDKEVNFVVKKIISNGKYYYSKEQFEAEYPEVYAPWINFMEELNEFLNQVDASKELMRGMNEMSAALRGRFTGAGFGLVGGIKGALKAEILNMATGATYSLINSFKEASADALLDKKMQKAYENEALKETLASKIYLCVYNISKCVARESKVREEDFHPKFPETAQTLMQNYKHIPKHDQLAILIEVLKADIYCVDAYEKILQDFENTEQICLVGKLFGLEDDLIKIVDRILIRECSALCTLVDNETESLEQGLDKCIEKKNKCGFTVELEQEKYIKNLILEECIPTKLTEEVVAQWDDIMSNLQKKKQELNVTGGTQKELKLIEEYDKYFTVNGLKCNSIDELKHIRELVDFIEHACDDLDGKTYEEFVAIKENIIKRCDVDPYSFMKKDMDKLDNFIKEKDIERRTYKEIVYETYEDAILAQKIEEESIEQHKKLVEDLLNKEDINQSYLKLVMKKVDEDPNIHDFAKQLFKEDYNKRIAECRIKSIFSRLDLDNLTSENYHVLESAKKELEEYKDLQAEEYIAKIQETMTKSYELHSEAQRIDGLIEANKITISQSIGRIIKILIFGYLYLIIWGAVVEIIPITKIPLGAYFIYKLGSRAFEWVEDYSYSSRLKNQYNEVIKKINSGMSKDN